MRLIDLIFPKQCFGCKSYGNYICLDCSTKLEVTQHQRCIVCQRNSLHGLTHPRCFTRSKPNRLISIFTYQDKIISQSLNQAKYGSAAEPFIELAELAACCCVLSSPNLYRFTVCSIPMSKLSQRWRGFNQSEIICQVLAKRFSLPIDNLLIKAKRTKPQKSLDKIARRENLQNAFQLKSLEALPQRVLLIDDVTTTGQTFLTATKILKTAGIKEVWCLALAQD